MNLKNYIMERAFCRPQGMLGRVGGQLMSLDRGLPAWVLDLLMLRPSDVLLEIGSGPGVGVALAAAKVQKVVGVDLSETMLNTAHRRNRDGVEAGRIALHLGTVDALPFEDGTFDAAMTINSLHLWQDPVRGLAEVKRTLRVGGSLALAVSRFSYASPDKFKRYMIDAGFANILVHTSAQGTCAIGDT